MTTPVATPLRLQLSRRKGFDLQAHSKALNGLECVNCARPGKWGNPYPVGKWVRPIGGLPVKIETAAQAVALFKAAALDRAAGFVFRENVARELPGKNLACWCGLCPKHADTGKLLSLTCTECAPCHCDVLGEIANR